MAAVPKGVLVALGLVVIAAAGFFAYAGGSLRHTVAAGGANRPVTAARPTGSPSPSANPSARRPAMELSGKRIAILVATGYQETELIYPYYRLQEAGAQVIVAGPEAGATIRGEGDPWGTSGLPVETTAAIRDLRAADLDAVHLPGGIYGPMALRDREDVLHLVREMVARGKIVGAICHGSWVLVSAGVVRGRRVACPPDIAVDLENAGATYVHARVARDGPVVTAVNPDCLPDYMREFMAAVDGG